MFKITYNYEKTRTKTKHSFKLSFSLKYLIILIQQWLGL